MQIDKLEVIQQNMDLLESNDKKIPIRVDFISEFHYKNCQHIIDNILEHQFRLTKTI